MEFRDKCIKNDEKLRLIFKVETSTEEAPESEVIIPEIQPEVEQSDEEEEEIITLNPNKLYESSGESDLEQPEEQPAAELLQIQTTAEKPPAPSVLRANRDKKEIFHCRYCDVVFSDALPCSEHEQTAHHPMYPFACVACAFKTDQHPTLIYHVKQVHNMDKPFLCTQCTKTFVRRSDLRKHTFVHAGIRLFSCDICKKSFTRNTNLTKHKRTHSEKSKTWKCTLCPKAFYNNSELSRHVEIHMDRKLFNCKHCSQAFSRRDLLEIHQKSHFENKPVLQIKLSPPSQQAINHSGQPEPIVFYNQPTEVAAPLSAPPMNFYTENTSFNADHSAGVQMQEIQPKKEYPIMNQLLTGMSQNFSAPIIKSFVCGICNKSFSKKKEHDRHVVNVHMNIRNFNCDECPKAFNRRDKLMRHKKTHLAPSIFNCPSCPAVFIRQHLLENHMKDHQIGNGENLESFLASLQPIANVSNGFTSMAADPTHQMIDATQVTKQTANPPEPTPPEPQAHLSPMNLSTSDNEPMNLSNDKMKVEPLTNTAMGDSDESNGLKIADDTCVDLKKSPLMSFFKNEPEVMQSDSYSSQAYPMDVQQKAMSYDEATKQPESHEITFSMTSRIAELDKLEPLRDLPMEILNND